MFFVFFWGGGGGGCGVWGGGGGALPCVIQLKLHPWNIIRLDAVAEQFKACIIIRLVLKSLILQTAISKKNGTVNCPSGDL